MQEQRRIGYLILVSSLLVITFTLFNAFYWIGGAESSGLAQTEAKEAQVGGDSVRLLIPKLDIDADVINVGVTASGNMGVPRSLTDVAWYKHGTKPGEIGSAVMAGHEDNAISIDGVFKHLEDLEPGDSVYVRDTNGKVLRFVVEESVVYPYNLGGQELERIFHDRSGRLLNLITCTGDWLSEARTNDKRLVVFTRLADE